MWLADDAQRVDASIFHCAPSPSGRSASAELDKFAGGIPYACIRNRVWFRFAQECSGAAKRSLNNSVSVRAQS